MFDFPINAVHLHLLLNHVPIVMSAANPFILGFGLYKGNLEMVRLALFFMFATSLLAFVVFVAGVNALEVASGLPDINVAALARHETAAKITIWLFAVHGAFSAGTLYYGKLRPEKNLARWCVVTLAISLVVLASASVTGYYGGNIRHTEIHYS